MVTVPVKRRRSTAQGRTLQYDAQGRPFRSEVTMPQGYSLDAPVGGGFAPFSPTVDNPGTPAQVASAFDDVIPDMGETLEQATARMNRMRARGLAGDLASANRVRASSGAGPVAPTAARMRPEEVDAQLRLMETVGNMNPSSPEPRLRAAPGDPLFAESYLQGSSGMMVPGIPGTVSNQTLGAQRIGTGVRSSGMTTGGTYGSSLMLGPGPAQQEVVKPAFAYKPGRGAMIGGREVSQEEFDSAWQRRGRAGAKPPSAAELYQTVTAPRVLPDTVPVAPSVVPGSNMPDDRPSVSSTRARQSMMPSSTGTQVRYRNPDGSFSVESMPVVGGAPRMPPGLRPPAAYRAPPVAPARPITGVAPGTPPPPSFTYPKGSMPAGAPPPPVVPTSPTGPAPNPIQPRFPPGRGGPAYNPSAAPTTTPTTSAAPTAPVTPAAAAAGGLPWGKAGMIGGGTVAGMAVGSALSGGDGDVVVPALASGPGQQEAYYNPLYSSQTIKPTGGAMPGGLTTSATQAYHRTRSERAAARGAGSGKQPDYWNQRAGVANARYYAENPQALSRDAIAAIEAQNGGGGRNGLGEGIAASIINQGANQRQQMTDIIGLANAETDPAKKAALIDEYRMIASQPQATVPSQPGFDDIRRQLIGGGRGPTAQPMKVPYTPPPAIPPPGTTASGTSTSGEEPPPAPTSAAEANKIASAATDKAIKEAKENAKKKLVESGKVPWDYDAEVVSVVPFDGSIGIEPAVAFIKSRYPSLTDEQIRQQIRERIKPRGSWYNPNAVFPGLSSP